MVDPESDAGRELGLLAELLDQTLEDERRRVAVELHSEVGQALTALKLQVQMLAAARDHEARVSIATETAALLDRAIGRVRSLSLSLRPPLIDELGAVPALRGLAEEQSRRSGVPVSVSVGASISRLPPPLELGLFRIVQESVTNALRHAAPSRVEVTLDAEEGAVTLSIRDDGRGFALDRALAAPRAERHLGLLAMRERARALGGDLEITTSPGHGTEIRACFSAPGETESV